jgi:hypothetical protein
LGLSGSAERRSREEIVAKFSTAKPAHANAPASHTVPRTVAGACQVDVGRALTSGAEATGSNDTEGAEETTGCAGPRFVAVTGAGEAADSVAGRVDIAQLKSPVGLLQTGGVKHLRITTIHNR